MNSSEKNKTVVYQCIKTFVLRKKKIEKILQRILKPEMSLDLLIYSYLLSRIKHMQEKVQPKSQHGKETTKINKALVPIPPSQPKVLWFC